MISLCNGLMDFWKKTTNIIDGTKIGTILEEKMKKYEEEKEGAPSIQDGKKNTRR